MNHHFENHKSWTFCFRFHSFCLYCLPFLDYLQISTVTISNDAINLSTDTKSFAINSDCGTVIWWTELSQYLMKCVEWIHRECEWTRTNTRIMAQGGLMHFTLMNNFRRDKKEMYFPWPMSIFLLVGEGERPFFVFEQWRLMLSPKIFIVNKMTNFKHESHTNQ